jgi:hypothetical protein
MIARMAGFHPDLAEWILADGYGRVLSRPGLSIRERELIVVAVLSALRLPKQLESHVRGRSGWGRRRGRYPAMLRSRSEEHTRHGVTEALDCTTGSKV